MRGKPDLLVIGASGSVARAFLRRLLSQRRRFGRVALVDKNRRVLSDRWVDAALKASFEQAWIRLPADRQGFRSLLRRHAPDIVLDLSDQDTLPILEETDAFGASYVNTCLNDGRRPVEDLVSRLWDRGATRAPHILCSGMNPGAVNMWVMHGVGRFGRPREVVHFEYDDSRPVGAWRPTITWSKRDYLEETVRTPSGTVSGRRLVRLLPNALAHREDMRPILEPIWRLDPYPRGFIVLHEENLTLARRLRLDSRFVYAIDARTMDHLVRTYRARGAVSESDLVLGNNTTLPLAGGDHVGVCLEYDDLRVYYVNSLANAAVVGTNATCAQVAVGIYCALFTLTHDRLDRRAHFVGDLRETSYRPLLFDNMRVEEFVFRRRPGELRLMRHAVVRPRARPASPRYLL